MESMINLTEKGIEFEKGGNSFHGIKIWED